MKELLLRSLTGILLIILVAGSILAGPVPLVTILFIVYGISIHELFSVYRQGNRLSNLIMAISAGFLLPIACAILVLHWNPLWFILPLLGWMVGMVLKGSAFSGRLVMFWLAIPLTAFYLLGWIDDTNRYSSLLPLSVIALVWINDTFAYAVGRLLGKYKMTPRLSPGKTWEGFAGGIGFTFLSGWILYLLTGAYSVGTWMLYSLIVGSFGLLGDLFESSLKRRMNVKNMSRLLPGHGGVLDRFDSLLLVAPVILILRIIIRLIA